MPYKSRWRVVNSVLSILADNTRLLLVFTFSTSTARSSWQNASTSSLPMSAQTVIRNSRVPRPLPNVIWLRTGKSFLEVSWCPKVESTHRYADLYNHMRTVHGKRRQADPILLPMEGAPAESRPHQEPYPKRPRLNSSPRRSPRATGRSRPSSSAGSKTQHGEHRSSPHSSCRATSPCGRSSSSGSSQRRNRSPRSSATSSSATVLAQPSAGSSSLEVVVDRLRRSPALLSLHHPPGHVFQRK